MSSRYEAYPYAAADGREADAGGSMRVLRGGSLGISDDPRAAFRSWGLEEAPYGFTGFRCARFL